MGENESNTRKKICFVTVTLSDGGAERCAALLSHYFYEKNYEVFHVVFAGKIDYNFKGKLFHLEHLKDKSNSIWSRWKRFNALRKYFKKEKFDIILDFRTKEFFLQELLIHWLVYKKFIQTIHSYKVNKYIPKFSFLQTILYYKCLGFVSVSKEINFKLKQDYSINNALCIYNPIDTSSINFSEFSIDYPYIIGVGSMNKNIKQFDKLIRMFSETKLVKDNVKLLILGDGKLRTKWEKLVCDLNLEDKVIFKGNIKNIYPYYKNALFTVSTSKYEGLPMVILESLSCGTPIISWDYQSGPSEIIHHETNGILVENQNIEKMIFAMNHLFLNEQLYSNCKQNAVNSVKHFNLNQIGLKWEQLFKNYGL